jgi:hypothetical protein
MNALHNVWYFTHTIMKFQKFLYLNTGQACSSHFYVVYTKTVSLICLVEKEQKTFLQSEIWSRDRLYRDEQTERKCNETRTKLKKRWKGTTKDKY